MRAVINMLAGLLLVAPISAAYAAEERPVVLDVQSEQASFKATLLTDDLDFAWDIEFLPGGGILLSEYDGRLRLSYDEFRTQRLIGPVTETTERGGLRGIVAHPDFAENRLLYFCFARGTFDNNHTRIARGRLIDDRVAELETIFVADNAANELAHYGCRLLWLDDGTLVATLGDRRHHMQESQDLANHYGTVIRVNADGSVPADNPFVATRGARPETWAYGIRNTQGAILHPRTRELWGVDHGPLGGDEVNILRPGRNYGWPVATFGIDYDRTVITDTPLLPDVEPPLYYWYPSIAPSSAAFYVGDRFPKWRGDLFVGSLQYARLLRLELIGDRIVRQEDLLGELNVRIRDVAVGPDGLLYVLTDTNDDRLLRLEPNQAP